MIKLYGKLGKQYPRESNIKVQSIGEAVRAMEANYPGFRNSIRKDGSYWIVRGDSLKEGKSVSNDELGMEFSNETWHICPIAAGTSGNTAGILTIVAGIALIAISYYVPPAGVYGAGLLAGAGVGAGFAGFVGTLGLAMVLGGVAQMMTPSPPEFDYGTRDDPEEKASYIFNGPVNVASPGVTVPVAYGTTYIGSVFISGGLKAETI